MRGDNWANVTGGGACKTDADCGGDGKGACAADGKCSCEADGMVAGAHCELFAIQCPEFADGACCSWQQNRGMAENFKLMASVFGKNAAGGCDACAANLLNLWCSLICSPQQDEFMALAKPFPSISYKPDPMTGEDHVKVLELNVTLEKEYTCAVFDSCKNTAMVSIAEAMKSSLGFLNYQMQTGAVGHGEFVNLHFQDGKDEKKRNESLSHHVYRCDNYSEAATAAALPKLPKQAQLLPSIASPSEKKQCPCSACRSTCDATGGGGGQGDDIHVVANPISVLDGFNTKLVALVYGLLGALALGWGYWKQR
jgi:hypothetical protein